VNQQDASSVARQSEPWHGAYFSVAAEQQAVPLELKRAIANRELLDERSDE
jgi:hypothetical protein